MIPYCIVRTCKLATKPAINQPSPIPIPTGKSISAESNAAQVIMATINYEVMVSWHSMASPAAKEKFYAKAYPALKKGFGEYVDAKSLTNPRALHHVYEWNKNGQPVARLWNIKRNKGGPDSFKIMYYFNVSKTVAPIDPILKKPGPSGKFVTKSAVFKNKAIVMESGQPVVVKRKTAKYLAIPAKNFNGSGSSKGIVFTRGPVTVRNPGGGFTTGAFNKAFIGWFGSGLATKYLKSAGIYKSLEEHTSRAGNNVPARIRNLNIRSSISKSEIESLAQAAVGGSW